MDAISSIASGLPPPATGALPDLSEFGGVLKVIGPAPESEGMSFLSSMDGRMASIPAPTDPKFGGARGKYKMGTQVVGRVYGPDPENPDGFVSVGEFTPETDLDKTVFMDRAKDGSAKVRTDLMDSGKKQAESRQKAVKKLGGKIGKEIGSLQDLLGVVEELEEPEEELTEKAIEEMEKNFPDDKEPADGPLYALKAASETKAASGKTAQETKMEKIEFTLKGYGTVQSPARMVRRVGTSYVALFRGMDDPGLFTPAEDSVVVISFRDENLEMRSFSARFGGLRFPDPMAPGIEIVIMEIVSQ